MKILTNKTFNKIIKNYEMEISRKETEIGNLTEKDIRSRINNKDLEQKNFDLSCKVDILREQNKKLKNQIEDLKCEIRKAYATDIKTVTHEVPNEETEELKKVKTKKQSKSTAKNTKGKEKTNAK